MKLKKSDIKRIGYQAYQDKKKLVITCDIKTASVEYLLLREILDEYGYAITMEEDWVPGQKGDPVEHMDINYFTNMPWSVYQKIKPEY